MEANINPMAADQNRTLLYLTHKFVIIFHIVFHDFALSTSLSISACSFLQVSNGLSILFDVFALLYHSMFISLLSSQNRLQAT